jgi:hypothetical protein
MKAGPFLRCTQNRLYLEVEYTLSITRHITADIVTVTTVTTINPRSNTNTIPLMPHHPHMVMDTVSTGTPPGVLIMVKVDQDPGLSHPSRPYTENQTVWI